MNLPVNPILQRLTQGAAAGPYQGRLPAPPPHGVEGFPLAALAHALGQAPRGVAPHFGAPTPPEGVTAAPEGSYNPAEFYRHTGQGHYAAELWQHHHPYAMAHGNEPAWVEQQFAHDAESGLHNGLHGPPGVQPPAGSSGVPNLGFHHFPGAPPEQIGPGGMDYGQPPQMIGSHGAQYTAPIRNLRRRPGLAQALGGGAVHPAQAV